MADASASLPSLAGDHWRALVAETDVFRILFDRMDEGYCVIEFFDGPHGPLSDYIHVAANPAYLANTGIENVVGKRLREMVGDEADAWVARYGEVLRTGEPIRFEQELVATGRHLELSAYRLGDLADRLVAVLFKDVTERKRAEQALARASEALEVRFAEALRERAQLASIVEGSDAFVQVTDMDLRWLAINRAAADEFERIFGVRPKVGDRATDLLADQPEQLAAVEAVWRRALAGESFIEVGRFGDPGRVERFYEMRFQPLFDGAGAQIGAFQFVYDVTDKLATEERLAQAESDLRQSQKMEAVGQLTGGLAHDFNNMLGGISGALELAQQRVAQNRPEEASRLLDAAREATDRAARLTHRLLAFSRRQTLTPTAIEPAALIDAMLELIRRAVGPSISVEADCEAELWNILVDGNQVENALLNLCINARDAMPQGGRIALTVRNWRIEPDSADAALITPGDYLRIAVADTGCGIPADVIERVFDPFFTTKPLGEGTGLGLSMVYGFVKQSHGYVFVDSKPGEGTEVVLALPRERGEMEAPSAPAGEVAGPARPGTILVVDDEVLIRMTVVEELTDNGFTCLEAASGQEALQLLESRSDIDLLLTDVGLPGGLNGRQVADAARVRRPDLPVLFITGYADNIALLNDGAECGMAVLTKPFRMADILNKVRELLLA